MAGRPFLEPYDLLFVGIGLALLLTTIGAGWLRRLNVSSTLLYLGVGLLAGPLFLDMAPADPLGATPVLERVAELAVILSLIVLGIRIGTPITWSRWQPTVRLILIVMPVTIVAVALTGNLLFGLALGPAVLLGAVLAPTDPILAGPLEEESLEQEDRNRFGLTSEAGLNDGLAFPFVYLGLNLTFATMVATAGARFSMTDRLYWAWFGIRGIGSVYYLSYALNHGVGDEVGRVLFTVVVATILVSSLLHGFTVPVALRRMEGDEEVEQ